MPDADPVTELREAARLMRQRAARARPWWSWDWRLNGPRAGTDGESGTERRREHIHSWHPGVALAVADWLDARAAEYDEVTSGPYGPAAAAFVAGGDADPAVTLARIYLGKSDDQPAT